MLVVPGRLHPIEEELSLFERRAPRTELLWLDNGVYRILWDTKEVDRADWGKIASWQKSKSATRVARLHTPFALEIQRAFAADLARIGMPVPPPLNAPQPVKLSCLDAQDGDCDLTVAGAMMAYSVGGERGVRLIMSEAFMNELPTMLSKAKDILVSRRMIKARQVAKDGPGPTAEVEKAIAKIDEIRGDATLMSGIRGPFTMPEPGKLQLVIADAIVLCLRADLRAANPWTPLRLAIVEPSETTDELQTSATA